jgi:hypothetical protein
LHAPIVHPAAVTTSARHVANAGHFLMRAPAARQIFDRFGIASTAGDRPRSPIHPSLNR